MKHTLYCDVAISCSYFHRNVITGEANQTQARRRGCERGCRWVGVSDNDVVHVEAEAHATQSTDRIEQRAGSSEGVKKIKEKHSTTEFVNIVTNAMQTTTAQAEMCRMTAHYIRVATRRVDDTLFMQLRMWVGLFRPRLRCSCARSQTVRRR